MKANELMIGDWVRESDGELIVITSIDEQDEGYWQVRGADRLLVEGGDLEPIPLTAEILEKNRYTPSLLPKGYAYKFDDDRVMTLERFGDYWVVRIYGNQIPMKCRSVHELQHALRLCGINIKIEL